MFWKCADAGVMKVILSVAVYLVLVFALGIVMAMTASREDTGPEQADGL